MNPRSLSAFRAALALSCLLLTGLARAEDAPPRAVMVLKSVDDLLKDLEHIIGDLAGKKKEWQNNVFPNIDIFLFGVDKTKPVRYDQIVGGKEGRREQMIVPVADLKLFITDDLDPIDIIAKPDRKDKSLYELKGDGYPGFMRYVHDYAYFARKEHKEDVPEKIAPPSETHQKLLDAGYDVAAQLDNSKSTPEQRKAAFSSFRENTLAGIQKKPDETKEAFELRKKSSEQSLDTFERLFVEASNVIVGVEINSKENLGTGKIVLAANQDTALAGALKLQGQKHSRFAGVAQPADPVLTGRMNYALDSLGTQQSGELYKLMQKPLEQRVDKTEGLTDDQKSARKELVGIVLNMLTTSLDLGKWDGMVQITTAASGKHTGVLGLCVKDGAPVDKIVELLPRTADGYKAELNVDTAGDVKIHKLTVTEKYPNALKDFFSESGELFIGAGPDTVWLSLGDGAVEALKAAVTAAANAPTGNVDPTVATLDMDLLPVLKLMGQLRKDGDFDLMGTLKNRGLLDPPAEEAAASTADKKDGSSEPSTAQMLKDFEWRDAAIEALDPKADRLHMDIKRVEDHLEGNGTLESGILKAIGDVIAKFAKENLG
ncbi:MAG: hypothetical protein U0992_14145 [Planctomycetaceae bacterium]